MAAGDLSFCSLHNSSHQSEFPTSHYHGVTVTIDFSGITAEMENVLELLSVDLKKIKELSSRQGYIRVKVLELLLVLTELDSVDRIEL